MSFVPGKTVVVSESLSRENLLASNVSRRLRVFLRRNCRRFPRSAVDSKLRSLPATSSTPEVVVFQIVAGPKVAAEQRRRAASSSSRFVAMDRRKLIE